MSKKWTAGDIQRAADKGLTVNLGVGLGRPPVRYVIGIDPGKNTGFSVYDRQERSLTTVTCVLIHQAFAQVLKYGGTRDVFVRVEDARKRKWFGKSGPEMYQGAGAAKRDATIWEDFLKDQGIPYEMVAPENNRTKLDAKKFMFLTCWSKKTNEHARDAAMLCYQR